MGGRNYLRVAEPQARARQSAGRETPERMRELVAAANSFKPHVATYTKAAELLGVKMEEVLFVANHAFDCIGAKSAGMHSAFIDRRKRPFGGTPHQPDLVVPDMKSLADTMV